MTLKVKEDCSRSEVPYVVLIIEKQSQQHKVKHHYITEVSLFFYINTQHPDALVSSWQGFYNCHDRN